MDSRTSSTEKSKGSICVAVFRALQKGASRTLLLTNLTCAVWLWWCCLSTRIPCDEHPYLGVTNISFPVALLCNLLFVAVWAVLQKRRIWLSLLFILPCWSYIMDYAPISFSQDVPKDCLKVLSWNTLNLGGSEGKEKAMEYLKNSDADIICLQETSTSGTDWEDFSTCMQEHGYEMLAGRGLVVFSRLHITSSDTIRYDTRSNQSTWCRLQDGEHEILLVNNHLESNRLSNEIKEEYTDALRHPEYQKVRESGHDILSLMVQAERYRGNQAKALHDFAQEHQRENILMCGDFNDTPVSYTYQHLSRVLKNAFRESGNGISLTYNKKGFWVRIDHIFLSKQGTSYKSHVDRSISVSDHFPIISYLKYK